MIYSKTNLEKVRTKLRSLTQKGAKADLEFCELLWEVHVGSVDDLGGMHAWELWGFKSLQQYVGTELHISVKRAYQSIAIWTMFGVNLAGKWDPKLLLPHTKMAYLARIVNAKNVTKWLKKARTMNCEALRQEVLKIEGKEPVSYFLFHAYLTNDELDRLNRSLWNAREIYGDRRTGAALLRIVDQYMEDHGLKKDD